MAEGGMALFWLPDQGGIFTHGWMGWMENELFVSLRPWGCFSPVHTCLNLQRESMYCELVDASVFRAVASGTPSCIGLS
jgi:hypothetical protein